ncbi:MAG: ribonuclease HI [Spirulinaceae cyanobacterium]
MESSRIIESLYTDGACTGNPGPGGWGVVVYFTDNSVFEMGGSAAQTTNNRMEMEAAVSALKILRACEQTETATIYTDSEYVRKGITQWIKGWKKKGWQNSQGKPVQNQDLWEKLDQLNSEQVIWKHVKGHSGNEGNERCDAIARGFAQGNSVSLQQKYSPLLAENAENFAQFDPLSVTGLSDSKGRAKILYRDKQTNSSNSDINMMESSAGTTEEFQLPREVRVTNLQNLIETLRIAEEISTKGYLISSAELADLMDVNASAVTSRGDNWPWRNWLVSRVRREGNQILWQLEKVA